MSEEPHSEDDERAEEQLTEIVSYLDGELDNAQMDEVEQQLINDPDMRSHADILSRTWALLDALEEVSADKKFTQDTLATVSAETVTEEAKRSGRTLRKLNEALVRYKVLPFFLAGILGGAVGIVMSRGAAEKRHGSEKNVTDILLKDFELVQNYERYIVIPDVDSLKELKLPDSASRPFRQNTEEDE